MNPETAKRLASARERLKCVDPGRADQTHTDLRYVLEAVLDALEERAASRFTARVGSDGVVVIPAPVRALNGVEPGRYVTLELEEVGKAPPA